MSTPREYCKPGVNIMLAHGKWDMSEVAEELVEWAGSRSVISEYYAIGQTARDVSEKIQELVESHEEMGHPLLIAARDPRILNCINPHDVIEANWHWYDENGEWSTLDAKAIAEIRNAWDFGLQPLGELLEVRGLA